MKTRIYTIVLSAFFALGLGIASPARAADETSSTQAKISAEYSQYLFGSVCAQNYRTKFRVSKLSEKDKQQLFKHTSDACACLYQQVAKSNSPEDITDYIMTKFSAKPKGYKETGPDKGLEARTIRPIAMITNDPDVRKKCGFVR